jgi:hypothetical protein
MSLPSSHAILKLLAPQHYSLMTKRFPNDDYRGQQNEIIKEIIKYLKE